MSSLRSKTNDTNDNSLLKSKSMTTMKSTTSTKVGMDPKQILSHCDKMRANLESLDNWIRLTQLKLTTINYAINSTDEHFNGMSTYDFNILQSFNYLLRLRELSQQLVHQLEELQYKLSNSYRHSMDYHIASQQCMFFTCELYENIQPRIGETFKMAAKIQSSPELSRYPLDSKNQNLHIAGGETRATDALLRLRQSMSENENLIATIANNVEHTKLTIDTIYDSIHSTKVNLDKGREGTIENIDELKTSRTGNMYCYATLILFTIGLAYFVLDILIF